MSARALCVLCWASVLTARAAAAPARPAADTFDIDDQATLLHTADHQVTRLGVLFGDDNKLDDKTVFFIESETDERGQRLDYGLYALHHGVTTKLLDSARDIAVLNLATAYFASKDGIYRYNKENNSAQKYGSVSDDVISLAVENGTGAMYYLNGQHQLYKVTEDGNKSSVVDAVRNAEEIVVDYTGHLYYYTAEHQFYVYDGREARRVEDIPAGMKRVWFVKTPMLAGEYALVNGDARFYGVRAGNASARALGRAAPGVSAVSADAGLLAYYARDRRLYEFNIIEKVLQGVLEGLSEAFKRVVHELRESFNSVYEG